MNPQCARVQFQSGKRKTILYINLSSEVTGSKVDLDSDTTKSMKSGVHVFQVLQRAPEGVEADTGRWRRTAR